MTQAPADIGTLIAQGRAGEALSITSQAIRNRPGDAVWMHLHGYALYATGAGAEALAAIESAIRHAPREPMYRNTFGAIALEVGRLDDAERSLREALDLREDFPEARFNLAQVLYRRSGAAEALAEIDGILRTQPDFLPARIDRAKLLVELGRAAEALPGLEGLLGERPHDVRVVLTGAAACLRLGDETRALDLASRAASSPQATPTDLIAAAETLGALRQPARARESMRRAIHAAPRPFRLDRASPNALILLAAELDAQRRHGEARELLSRAIDHGERAAAVLSALAFYKARACDWDGLDELVAEMRLRALEPSPYPAYPSHALYFDGITAADQRRWAENWAAVRWKKIAPRPAPRGRRDRLRVGFLSADFRDDHPTSRLAVAFLEARDSKRFEYVAYSHHADDGSAPRRRIENAFDRFVDVRRLDDEALADRIRGDEVDILLDLGGYTEGSRMDALSLRPAPVQGHFLGYPGTTGAPFMDLFVSDRVASPEGADAHFTERLLRMPATYQPNDPKRALPPAPSRAECGLPPEGLVLCSFNQAMKITPRVFALWCELLRQSPRACLWLRAYDDECRANLRAAAARHDVDPSRLVFARPVPVDEHIARTQVADIALDSFPCTSHTTASDMLWAGIPFATHHGDTFASRVAASVLTAAQLKDFCHADARSAFTAVSSWISDPGALEIARERARASHRSPLVDAAAFARDFEALLMEAARPW